MTPIESAVDYDFVTSFLVGYELFSDSKEIWSKIQERYFVPPKQLDQNQTRFIKIRSAHFVVQWLKNDIWTIDPQVLECIDKFSEKTLKREALSDVSIIIKRELDTQVFTTFGEKDRVIPKDPPASLVLYGLIGHLPYEVFLSADPKSIAEQITLMEFDIYSRILRSELLNQRWSKEKYQFLSKNVTSLVQRSDKLSHFIASIILYQKKLRDRKKILTRVIRVAQALLELHNFNGLMGVLMGLTLSSISRLKHTWSKLTDKTVLMYKNLTNYQNPANSFKCYRESIVTAQPPCLPYLCMYLSDLTFMDEGNPDFINVGDLKLINFPKHFLVYSTIKKVQQYQSGKYDIDQREPLYTLLYQLPGLEEKELYALSLEREPRDVTLRDLELRDKKD